jgi:hypothetical protein
MNVIEILKKKDTNKKYITNYKGEEMIVKIVECCGGEYDIVRVIKDDEREYRDRGLTEFMYMSEITNLEFKEVIDWAKVPIDTKILVKDTEDCCVYAKRYFAEFKDGYIYTWADGKTSFTTQSKTKWSYGKLYEEN